MTNRLLPVLVQIDGLPQSVEASTVEGLVRLVVRTSEDGEQLFALHGPPQAITALIEALREAAATARSSSTGDAVVRWPRTVDHVVEQLVDEADEA